MPPYAVSAYFCCADCQSFWHNQRVTRPHEVYASTSAHRLVEADATDQRLGKPLTPAHVLPTEG